MILIILVASAVASFLAGIIVTACLFPEIFEAWP
jgi:hypothetical protein